MSTGYAPMNNDEYAQATMPAEGVQPQQSMADEKEQQEQTLSIVFLILGLFICPFLHFLNCMYKESHSAKIRQIYKASMILAAIQIGLFCCAVVVNIGIVVALLAAQGALILAHAKAAGK